MGEKRGKNIALAWTWQLVLTFGHTVNFHKKILDKKDTKQNFRNNRSHPPTSPKANTPKPPGGGCAEQEAQEAQRGHKDQKSDQTQVHQAQDLNASQAVPQPHPKIRPPQAGSSESSATLIVWFPSFCSCAYYCIRWLALASFFKGLVATWLSKRMTKRLALIANRFLQQQSQLLIPWCGHVCFAFSAALTYRNPRWLRRKWRRTEEQCQKETLAFSAWTCQIVTVYTQFLGMHHVMSKLSKSLAIHPDELICCLVWLPSHGMVSNLFAMMQWSKATTWKATTHANRKKKQYHNNCTGNNQYAAGINSARLLY